MTRQGSTAGERTLSVEQARSVYNHIGARQDWQSFFEDPAIEAMLTQARLDEAKAIFEFGCGTGRLAEQMLAELAPQDCRYSAIDLSPVMVELARARLARFGGRVEVRLSDGSSRTALPEASFDRFVSTYVFDLLSHEQIQEVIAEAHRLLRAEGMLCAASGTDGEGPIARLVSRTWRGVWAWSPRLVGGCRPIELTEFLTESRWRIAMRQKVCAFGVTSEAIVAVRK